MTATTGDRQQATKKLASLKERALFLQEILSLAGEDKCRHFARRVHRAAETLLAEWPEIWESEWFGELRFDAHHPPPDTLGLEGSTGLRVDLLATHRDEVCEAATERAWELLDQGSRLWELEEAATSLADPQGDPRLLQAYKLGKLLDRATHPRRRPRFKVCSEDDKHPRFVLAPHQGSTADGWCEEVAARWGRLFPNDPMPAQRRNASRERYVQRLTTAAKDLLLSWGADLPWPPDRGWHVRGQEVAVAGRVTTLTGNPHRLIKALAAPGREFASEALISAIWGQRRPSDPLKSLRTLSRQTENNLRSGIEGGAGAEFICKHGRGYAAMWSLADPERVAQALEVIPATAP